MASTGESAITTSFSGCPHHLDDGEILLEIEAGRHTASGWQHLAWIDTDTETPGLQIRTAIYRASPPELDWNDNPIKTITRKFVVSPSVSFSFDSDSVLPDGKVVVVKRSTDPVRINNSTATVHATGLANGTYRLVADGARFHNNDLTISTVELDGGTGDSEIYGDLPSSAMGDATLSLQTIGGTTLCTTNFTVLWVEISMRCGQDEPFSADNGMQAHSSNPIYDKLGMQHHYGFILPSSTNNSPAVFGNIVEIIGTVYPSDFSNRVELVRDCIDELSIVYFTNGTYRVDAYATDKARGNEPAGNDATEIDFLDADPRPNGRVFDVDTPGISVRFPEFFAHGTRIFARYNFLQYAVFGLRRCSNDFPWYSRTTIRRNNHDDPAEFEFYSRPYLPSDNECGTGRTSIQP